MVTLKLIFIFILFYFIAFAYQIPKNKKIIEIHLYFVCVFSFLKVSEYLKKQMVAVEGQETEEVKNMLKEHDKLVEEIFQHEDKDKNGLISHDEFSGPKHDEL